MSYTFDVANTIKPIDKESANTIPLQYNNSEVEPANATANTASGFLNPSAFSFGSEEESQGLSKLFGSSSASKEGGGNWFSSLFKSMSGLLPAMKVATDWLGTAGIILNFAKRVPGVGNVIGLADINDPKKKNTGTDSERGDPPISVAS